MSVSLTKTKPAACGIVIPGHVNRKPRDNESRGCTWIELTNGEQREAMFRGFPRGSDILYFPRKGYRDGELMLSRWYRHPAVRQIGTAVYDPRHEAETPAPGVATLYVRAADGSLAAIDSLQLAANVDRASAESYARAYWPARLTADYAITVRVAGESVPSFIRLAPSVADAIDYARSILPAGAIVCGAIRDGALRNVIFALPGDRARRVLATWFDGSTIYGEW